MAQYASKCWTNVVENFNKGQEYASPYYKTGKVHANSALMFAKDATEGILPKKVSDCAVSFFKNLPLSAAPLAASGALFFVPTTVSTLIVASIVILKAGKRTLLEKTSLRSNEKAQHALTMATNTAIVFTALKAMVFAEQLIRTNLFIPFVLYGLTALVTFVATKDDAPIGRGGNGVGEEGDLNESVSTEISNEEVVLAQPTTNTDEGSIDSASN